MARTKQRLQFDFSTAAVQALKDLTEATGAPSMAETVRHALALYEILGPAVVRGAAIVVREPDGSEQRVILAR